MNLNDLEWAVSLLSGSLAGARALTVSIMIRYGEWDQLVNLAIDPSEYLDYDFLKFRRDHQATELFRKCIDLPTTIDRKSVAVQSFIETETQCLRTNQRLLPLIYAIDGPNHYNQPSWLVEFCRLWRNHCKEILRGIPKNLEFRFSSGSTFDDRMFIQPMDKMSSRPTITEDAYGVIVPFWERTLWARSLCKESPRRSSPRIIRGNRFTTVPKSAKTDRGICVEPSLNVCAQKHLGVTIRERLSAIGLDLQLGQSKHQKLVCDASLTRALATIDLSSASDTVSYNLVKLIIPSNWFDLLDSLRAKETYIDGHWRTNAKFSSMGNGYTFELETLIFYTLALTVRDIKFPGLEGQISVYGDDIIVPDPMASELLSALRFFGFIPNKKKTFLGGVAFRESCGADYFNGVPVRGHNIEKLPENPLDWIKLANGISRMARYDLETHGDLNCYTPSWIRVINNVPKDYRNYGPVHLGDSVIFTNDETRWKLRYKRGYPEIRVTRPCFEASSYSRVDRREWTRGSIIAAAIESYLIGAGDSHVFKDKTGWIVRSGRFLKTRPKLAHEGWVTKWQPFSYNSNYPAWLCQPAFGVRKDARGRHVMAP